MVSNVRTAANYAVANIRNSAAAVIPENRSYTFYYVLIISLFVVLALLTYFYSTIKDFLENLFYKIKTMIFPVEEPPTPDASDASDASASPDASTASDAPVPNTMNVGREEVFHINNNIYTYSDATAVCRSFGADLATEAQVQDAYTKGADWCSYGWIKGQQAVYPTQQATYDSLQKGPADHRDSCGKVGLNGGYFDNPDLRFGVTCYGTKPNVSKTSRTGIELPPSTEEIEFEKKVQRFRDQSDATTIDPWNRSTWSSS